MLLRPTLLLLFAASSASLRLTVSRRDLLAFAPLATPAAALAAPSVSLSDFLDDMPTTATEDKAAAALREQLAAEDALKQERAATAIARMENSAATAQRAKERAAASGLPPCPDGVWGSGNTGLLSAQACYRERDGMMEQKKASGFLVVF